ncbi:hypothetical protein HMPREF0496_1797 [Lentilactobacillus hilgardii ATCC 27305]|nr:hypothetical protein HMPREF0496_1797 [Lentilactobacillus hilgardii ATCC 27305]
MSLSSHLLIFIVIRLWSIASEKVNKNVTSMLFLKFLTFG